MNDLDLREVQAFKAVKEINSDHFWCKNFGELCPKHNGICGKECEAYAPKNGKNGCCRHVGHLYTPR